MKNDLFSIGPFTVHGYGLMIAIGVLSAYYMVEYRAKKKQMDWEKVFPLTVWWASPARANPPSAAASSACTTPLRARSPLTGRISAVA